MFQRLLNMKENEILRMNPVRTRFSARARKTAPGAVALPVRFQNSGLIRRLGLNKRRVLQSIMVQPLNQIG